MVRKAVSFTTDLGFPAERKFKTWPKRAIKHQRRSKPAYSSNNGSIETVVLDVYNRFRSLRETDIEQCINYIVNGDCKDTLVGYSVLNTILKSSGASDPEDELSSASSGEIQFDNKTASDLLSRACEDLNNYFESTDVLDSRVLQQIMRAVEAIWIKNSVSKSDTGHLLAKFAQLCIQLIDKRPGSKQLLSPAVRISNLALDESLLTADQVKQLILALSRTHFVFAVSFTAEVMVVLTTINRVQPNVLRENAAIWVPLAVRALVSSSHLTRTLALHLLAACDSGSKEHVALALSQPSEPQRPDSELLVKNVVRKLTLILNANSSNPMGEEIRSVIESWCLVLDSATQTAGQWPLLDYWLEAERVAFKTSPKSVSLAWSSLIAAQKSDPSYCKVLLVPFIVLSSTDLPVSRMLNEALAAVDCNLQMVWEDFLFPLFKILGQRKDSGVLQAWAGLAPSMQFSENNVPAYLEVLTSLFKNVSNQNIAASEIIWVKILNCCTKSRSRAMELVRFHYHFLSQESTASSLPLHLTSLITKTWPFALLTERPKNNSFSLLTLVLLPVVVFVPTDKQSETLDRLLANCKSESALRSMLTALLHTVHTGSDNQLAKWMVAGSTIREYLGGNSDPNSAAVCIETLLTFINLMRDANSSQWAVWYNLFSSNTTGREKVMSKLEALPSIGLKYILNIDGFQADKIRIMTASIIHNPTSSSLMAVLKQANLASEMVDSIARELIGRKRVDLARLSLELVTPSRIFVVAKPLLAAINESQASDLVEFWNLKVAPALDRCPAFVSKPFADALSRSLPKLNIPATVLIAGGSQQKVPPPAATTPPKRQRIETPPTSSSKRSRRTILTGSVPPSLSTPPVSSDPPEEVAGAPGPSDDLLCSSPPQRSKSSGSSLPRETWRNSQQERARTLKRVMMGLDMDEAVQDMKRSEQEMIYNLMFRSCVKLRTHLAATGPSLPASEVADASKELESTVIKRESLIAAEHNMIESGKQRALEFDSQGSISDDDSDVDVDDEDEDEYIDSRSIKLEV